MQNKGFIGTIAVLLILICGFYISFSFVTEAYEEEADAYAAKIAKTHDTANKNYKDSRKAYMDSLENENVYMWYNYGEVKKMAIGLGLDLKGGMNLVLEVPTTEVIRSYAKNDAALQKVNAAIKKVLPQGDYNTAGSKPSDRDFVNKFAATFQEGTMAGLFAREGEFMGRLTATSSKLLKNR